MLSLSPSRWHGSVRTASATPSVAVAPQYDSTHVYVAPEDVDRFVASFLGTFGGKSGKQVVTTVTPTPSRTSSQMLQTPVGMVSLFGFKTPIPFPFGAERTGYVVTDLDAAVRAARESGAAVLVTPFADPIGRDAVIQWPGGVNMQLYWHTTAPSYALLQTVPENSRLCVSGECQRVHPRISRLFHGTVVSDEAHASGVEIGRPDESYRRIRIASPFGKMCVLVTDGHLPYPYGRETTGYEVASVADTLAKAKAAGAVVLVPPYISDQRSAAMVQFPGGYIAEIHSIERQ